MFSWVKSLYFVMKKKTAPMKHVFSIYPSCVILHFGGLCKKALED